MPLQLGQGSLPGGEKMPTAGDGSMLEDLGLFFPHIIFCGEVHLTAAPGRSAPPTKCPLRDVALFCRSWLRPTGCVL